MNAYFDDDKLLAPPMKRAAFSDRMAYVMAEMSRLAYFKWEGGHRTGAVLDSIGSLVTDEATLESIKGLLDGILGEVSSSDSLKVLSSILGRHGYELVETYNKGPTQAFLCLHRRRKMLILAIRGTEKKYEDLKADINAELIQIPGTDSVVHEGFYDQYCDLIASGVERNILDYEGYQLFITGHSMGGAVATIFTKLTANDSTGACYTFGAPPVSKSGFLDDVKTPVYRIINHTDIVPRLPNPYMAYSAYYLYQGMFLIIAPFGGLADLLMKSAINEKIRLLLVGASEYRQSGYGSYLVGEGRKTKHRYTVSSFDRLIWWFKALKFLFRGNAKFINDHSIAKYSEKLRYWANR